MDVMSREQTLEILQNHVISDADEAPLRSSGRKL
jgi:hypothetical protein